MITDVHLANSTLRSMISRPLKRGRACMNCRFLKIKCDGQKPTCGPCRTHPKDDECEYSHGPARSRTKALEDTFLRLEKRLHELEHPEQFTPSANDPPFPIAPSSHTMEKLIFKLPTNSGPYFDIPIDTSSPKKRSFLGAVFPTARDTSLTARDASPTARDVLTRALLALKNTPCVAILRSIICPLLDIIDHIQASLGTLLAGAMTDL
ncbi:hypothetical protein DFH09DRAFT_1360942 [Mycena vulgaris]|nr:hypothetical protein DFH09DRAFT_1360942 [Mycena vulgaris]